MSEPAVVKALRDWLGDPDRPEGGEWMPFRAADAQALLTYIDFLTTKPNHVLFASDSGVQIYDATDPDFPRW